jgi:hypothetical protein
MRKNFSAIDGPVAGFDVSAELSIFITPPARTAHGTPAHFGITVAPLIEIRNSPR